MGNIFILFLPILLVGLVPQDVSTAKILGFFPHIGKSHFLVFEPLLKELASRGHQVHVVSHFPQKTPAPNYTDISLGSTGLMFGPTEGVTIASVEEAGPWSDFIELAEWGTHTCEVVYSLPPFKELLISNDTFDLFISELFNTDCFLGLIDKFKVPHVALSSCSLMPWANDRFGNPDHPAYIANNLLNDADLKQFHNRLKSTILLIAMKVVGPFLYGRPAQSIAEKHFESTMPAIENIARNTSLILVNTHPSLNTPRPMVPSVVEVGGLHLKPSKPLPQELDRWLNESRHGVVYFNMGSMLRAESFPSEKRAALLQAFAELPQRVLWKWEGDSLPGQPDNVRVAKWLPQRDVLSHPNVRAFMTHGGLLGVIEGVVSGVPMVAIPMYGDQNTNSQDLVDRGVGVLLQYRDISRETVLQALRTVLENPSYQENAKRLAQQYLDRPLSPMDTAIFWIEYVIRHKGAHHLRSAAVDLTWYQYLLLDVAIVLLTAAVVAVFAIREIIQLCRYRWGQIAVTKLKPKQN